MYITNFSSIKCRLLSYSFSQAQPCDQFIHADFNFPIMSIPDQIRVLKQWNSLHWFIKFLDLNWQKLKGKMSLFDNELIGLLTQSALILEDDLNQSVNEYWFSDEISCETESPSLTHFSWRFSVESIKNMGACTLESERCSCIKKASDTEKSYGSHYSTCPLNTRWYTADMDHHTQDVVPESFTHKGNNSCTNDKQVDWIYRDNSRMIKDTDNGRWICPYFGYHYDNDLGSDFTGSFLESLGNTTSYYRQHNTKVMFHCCFLQGCII